MTIGFTDCHPIVVLGVYAYPTLTVVSRAHVRTYLRSNLNHLTTTSEHEQIFGRVLLHTLPWNSPRTTSSHGLDGTAHGSGLDLQRTELTNLGPPHLSSQSRCLAETCRPCGTSITSRFRTTDGYVSQKGLAYSPGIDDTVPAQFQPRGSLEPRSTSSCVPGVSSQCASQLQEGDRITGAIDIAHERVRRYLVYVSLAYIQRLFS